VHVCHKQVQQPADGYRRTAYAASAAAGVGSVVCFVVMYTLINSLSDMVDGLTAVGEFHVPFPVAIHDLAWQCGMTYACQLVQDGSVICRAH
jgi:hypothetical protein